MPTEDWKSLSDPTVLKPNQTVRSAIDPNSEAHTDWIFKEIRKDFIVLEKNKDWPLLITRIPEMQLWYK
jgi:hypothetical protein